MDMENEAPMEPAAMMDEPAALEEKPAEEMALMGDEAQDKTQAEEDEFDESETCPCCCCFCQCSTHETRDLKCFGCFPIRFGVALIGITTLFLTVAIYCEVFFLLLSETVHWWYVVVAVVLLIPLIISCAFFILFFSADTNSSRGKLDPACYLAIISFTLLAIWNIIYFLVWYKPNTIDFGTQWTGYWTQTKKQYIFWSIFITFWLDVFYGYFTCSVRRYWYRLKDKEEKPSDDMMNMMMGMDDADMMAMN